MSQIKPPKRIYLQDEMRDLSDEELMDMIKAGEMKAFETLFFRHRNKVFGYLLNKSGDREASEDLLQEVFEKVFKKAHTFNGDYKFLPWVFTITRNALTDHFRRAQKEELLEDGVSPSELSGSEESAREKLPHLIDLDQLPERYKEALNLRYFEDQEFSEISRRMGISADNARKTVSRALALLKRKALGGKE